MEKGDGGFVPLAQDIAKLGLGAEYSQMLLEQFSGFDGAIARLEAMLMPVSGKLEPLLQPWVEQAQPLAAVWQDYYQQPDFAEKWRKRVRCSEEERPLEAIRVQLRYLHPKAGPGSLSAGSKLRSFTPVSLCLWSGRRQKVLRAGSFRPCGCWEVNRGCECSGPCWTSLCLPGGWFKCLICI